MGRSASAAWRAPLHGRTNHSGRRWLCKLPHQVFPICPCRGCTNEHPHHCASRRPLLHSIRVYLRRVGSVPDESGDPWEELGKALGGRRLARAAQALPLCENSMQQPTARQLGQSVCDRRRAWQETSRQSCVPCESISGSSHLHTGRRVEPSVPTSHVLPRRQLPNPQPHRGLDCAAFLCSSVCVLCLCP